MYNESIKLTPNAELRAAARQQLKGNWGMALLVCLLYYIILSAASSLAGIGALIIGGPLGLGLAIFFIRLKRERTSALEGLFDGFKNFTPSLVLYLLITIFTLLWTMLLFIPGIIAALRYSMAYYILNDNPNLSGSEALNRSKQMMAGHNGKLFALYISFIGWALLCLLTFGIGFLWLEPYIRASVANFYEDLKSAAMPNSNQPAPTEA